MHRLNELAAQLTPEQLKDAEAYVEKLVARGPHPTAAPVAGSRPNRIQLDQLVGLLTRVDDGMPWPELKKRLRSIRADSAED